MLYMAGHSELGVVEMRLLSGLFLLLAAFTMNASAAKPDAEPPFVLAASSLQESMTAAADAWAKQGHPRPVIAFGASSSLARQIAAGGAADLFVSADEAWMNDLARRKLIVPETRYSFLNNKLVIIAPAASKVKIDFKNRVPLATALMMGKLAMADPDSVPAGRYGRIALERLNVWFAVSPNIVRAENVRAALALVERGAAPLGIVYATDALTSTKVHVVGNFPASSYPPITYPIARLTASTNPDADAFRQFLLSKEGKAIFARHGFGVF